MSVELIVGAINGVSIVSVSGKLTLGEGVGVLRHRLATLEQDLGPSQADAAETYC